MVDKRVRDSERERENEEVTVDRGIVLLSQDERLSPEISMAIYFSDSCLTLSETTMDFL